MMRFGSAQASALVAAFALAGCGTYVPAMQEVGEIAPHDADFSAGGFLEYNVKTKIYCDIVDAVIASRREGVLPTGWAVQTTLDLQVEEAGSFNPGATYLDPLRSFSLGAGAAISSQSTREHKYGSYWNLDKLKSRNGNPCRADGSKPGGSSLLLSELGITEWLVDSLKARFYLPSSEGKKADPFFKQDYLSYHVKFVVASSGGVSPTWKLVRVATGNGNLPLVSAGRTRNHDLLLTFGPTFNANTPNFAITSHANQDLGIAVSNGRSLMPRE